MLATFMETQFKKLSPLIGKVAVSLIHHGTSDGTHLHKVLVSGNEQGLRSLVQLLRRVADSEG
jgi:hypothetical protein